MTKPTVLALPAGWEAWPNVNGLWQSELMTVDASRGLGRSVFLTARRHVDYGRVRSAMCPASSR